MEKDQRLTWRWVITVKKQDYFEKMYWSMDVTQVTILSFATFQQLCDDWNKLYDNGHKKSLWPLWPKLFASFVPKLCCSGTQASTTFNKSVMSLQHFFRTSRLYSHIFKLSWKKNEINQITEMCALFFQKLWCDIQIFGVDDTTWFICDHFRWCIVYMPMSTDQWHVTVLPTFQF
jgi:hypothetical protein